MTKNQIAIELLRLICQKKEGRITAEEFFTSIEILTNTISDEAIMEN